MSHRQNDFSEPKDSGRDVSDNNENDSWLRRPFFKSSRGIQKSQPRTFIRPHFEPIHNYETQPFKTQPGLSKSLGIDIEYETQRLKRLEDQSRAYKRKQALTKVKGSFVQAYKDAIEQNAVEQNNAIKAELERTKAELTGNINILSAKNAALLDEQQEYKDVNCKMRTQLEEARQAQSDMQVKIDSRMLEIDTQKREIDTQKQKIATQEREIDFQKQEINSRVQENDTLKQAIVLLKLEIGTQSSEIELQKESITLLRSDVNALTLEHLEVSNEKKVLEASLSAQSTECSALKNRLKTRVSEYELLLAKKDQAIELCDNQSNQLSAQARRIRDLESLCSDNQSLSERYEILRLAMDEAREALIVRHDKLVIPIKTIQSDLHQYQTNYTNLMSIHQGCLSEHTSLKLELTSKENEINELAGLAERQQEQLQSLDIHIAKLKASLAFRDSELDRFEDILADTRATEHNHAESIQQLKIDMATLTDTNKALVLNAEHLSMENSELKRECSLVADQLGLNEQQHAMLDNALKSKDEQLSQQKQQIHELESFTESQQSSIDDLTRQVDNCKLTLSAFAQRESSLKSNAEEKLSELYESKAKIETLEFLNEELSSRLQIVESSVTAYTDALTEKTSLLQAAQSEMQKSEGRLRALVSENTAISKELMDADSSIRLYKTQLTDALDEIKALHKKQVEVDARNRELIATLDSKDKLWGSKTNELILGCNSQVETIGKLQDEVGLLATERSVILEKLIAEQKLRRLLTHKIVELKGSIRVFCRVRPLLPGEADAQDFQIESSDEGEMSINIRSTNRFSTNSGTTARFVYDRIFSPLETNEHVFDEVELLIRCSIDGYNACIFAYGQTGSGKSYTMCSDDGVIARSIAKIFELIDSSTTAEITVSGQFVEIYNENIYDLTEDKHDGARSKLELRQLNGKTSVVGAKSHNLDSQEALEQLLNAAHKRRSTAATAANSRSSRSHSVFIIQIRNRNVLSGKITTGTLNLIDLAGSERLNESKVEGERLKETQAINKSLSALGNVIQALGTGTSMHIPFRASKLTHMLQDSLNGTSKTLMIVNVTSASKSLNETLSTLTFADKVSHVKLKK